MAKDELETPTILRRQMYAKLPEELKTLAEEIAVKTIHAERLSMDVENASARLTVKRDELTSAVSEINELQTQLNNRLKKFAREAL